jgi:hypothetical protein
MKQIAVTRLDTYVSGTTSTLTNKTLTAPVINNGVLNTSLSGTAFLDEDNLLLIQLLRLHHSNLLRLM